MAQPFYFEFDEFKTRVLKLKEIKSIGIDPYPHHYCPTSEVKTVLQQYNNIEVGEYDDALCKNSDYVCVAGRLVLHRVMGKNIFAQIQDESSRIQLLFNRDVTKVNGLPDESEINSHKFIEKKLDLGDIIGVEGHLFRTQKGELTIFVTSVTLLCKSLLPLPDKHSGLADKESRYRKRWLDLISNPDVMDTFKLRSKIISLIRKFFDEKGFLEVETPTIEKLYGGAMARPFTTELNALHMKMYMRIALEISLKKLIIGGMRRVYVIGKLFRNEGIDATHNPEFTMVECYSVYWDYNDVMHFTENLYESIAKELFGTTKIGIRKDKRGKEYEIDLKTPWIRLSMVESIKEYGEIDISNLDNDEIRKFLLKDGLFDLDDISDASRGQLIMMLFEEFVENKLIQPHFIIDHPIESTPLCKLHRNKELARQGFVERFEGFILGTEICNAYTELNDPILQRELLERQERLLESGDEEANPLDEEFLEAICQGMPPCGGLGIGIDRMIMLFANEQSIRDVIFFPIMKHAEPVVLLPT